MIELFSRAEVKGAATIVIVAFVAYRVLLVATSQLKRLASFEANPVAKTRRAQRAETLRSIVNNTVRVAILVVAGVMVVEQFVKVDIAPLIAGAGVVGIALGFGAQSLVRDYLSGALIIIENQFDIGDQITIAGHTGTVEQMTLRMTLLRDGDGGVHIVPNGKIDAVLVHAREWARANVVLTVSYSDDLSRVLDVVGRAAQAYADEIGDAALGPPEVLGVDEFSPTGPRILLTMKTKPGRSAEAARELRRRVKETFDSEGIRFGMGAGVDLPASPQS